MPDHVTYRLYVADLAESQRLLEAVVADQLVGLLDSQPGLRWYFDRSGDAAGPHVQLTVGAPAEVLAAVEPRLDALLTAAYGADPPAWARRGAPRGGRVTRGYRKRLYAPEYERFGGKAGVDLAEQVFAQASRAALSCFGPGYWRIRLPYATVHLELVTRPLPPIVRGTFLHQYAWYWAGGLARRPADVRAALATTAARVRPAVQAEADAVAADETRAAPLTGYADALWSALRSPEREQVPRTDPHLLFDHVHLMHNRLGLTPFDEAVVAYLVRAGVVAGRPA